MRYPEGFKTGLDITKFKINQLKSNVKKIDTKQAESKVESTKESVEPTGILEKEVFVYLDLIQKLEKKGEINKEYRLSLISGLDSEKAWKIREEMLDSDMLAGVSHSLAGLDSERAWNTREEILKKDGYMLPAVIVSLAGLDSERAWEMRKKFEEEYLDSESYHDCVFFSLMGLDSERAQEMRKKLFDKDPKCLSNAFVGTVFVPSKKLLHLI